MGPSMSYTAKKCMDMLECIDKELSILDKELSVSVYLRSRNHMIELYKDEKNHALCSIKTLRGKRTIIHTMD